MNDREQIKKMVDEALPLLHKLPEDYDALINAVLAYGEQVRGEQREIDAEKCDEISVAAKQNRKIMSQQNNVYAARDCEAARIASEECAAAIRANDQGTKPKGEVRRLGQPSAGVD